MVSTLQKHISMFVELAVQYRGFPEGGCRRGDDVSTDGEIDCMSPFLFDFKDEKRVHWLSGSHPETQ